MHFRFFMMTGSNDILSKTKAKFFKTQKTAKKKNMWEFDTTQLM